MEYNKTSWQDGDVITAEKLNNLEDGVEASQIPITYLYFNFDYTTRKYQTDQMTYEELSNRVIYNGDVYVVFNSSADHVKHTSFVPVKNYYDNTGHLIGLGFYVFDFWSDSSTVSGLSCKMYIINDDMTINETPYSTKKLQYVS